VAAVDVRSLQQLLEQLASRDAEMDRDIAEDSGERACLQGVMPRNGQMMFAVLLRRQTEVASRLTGDLLTEPRQEPGKLFAADIARQLHGTRTSSCTW
jgi:hypothetical protein